MGDTSVLQTNVLGRLYGAEEGYSQFLDSSGLGGGVNAGLFSNVDKLRGHVAVIHNTFAEGFAVSGVFFIPLALLFLYPLYLLYLGRFRMSIW